MVSCNLVTGEVAAICFEVGVGAECWLYRLICYNSFEWMWDMAESTTQEGNNVTALPLLYLCFTSVLSLRYLRFYLCITSALPLISIDEYKIIPLQNDSKQRELKTLVRTLWIKDPM